MTHTRSHVKEGLTAVMPFLAVPDIAKAIALYDCEAMVVDPFGVTWYVATSERGAGKA